MDRTSFQEEGRSYETRWQRQRSPVSVPFSLPVMIVAGLVVLTVIALIIYAAVQPVASHIGMG